MCALSPAGKDRSRKFDDEAKPPQVIDLSESPVVVKDRRSYGTQDKIIQTNIINKQSLKNPEMSILDFTNKLQEISIVPRQLSNKKRGILDQNKNILPQSETMVVDNTHSLLRNNHDNSDFVDENILMSNADLEGTLSNGWTLFEHQKEAIRRCIIERRCILAYDMGLGNNFLNYNFINISNP